jgi:2-polyprenyl-3-methyl-5-hydroxy-6-metoxy-1,4-benzoquinol methylase
MRLPVRESTWPDEWLRCYHYDRLELLASDRESAGHEIGYCRAYRERFTRTLAAVERSAPPGSSVLDVAGAQGNFSLALAERGYHVTWNDLREDLIPYVRAKHERGDVRYAAGNVFELEFAEGFDLVLATEIIEHLAHPDRFVARLATLVRPGGSIVLTTPNGSYWRNKLPRFTECANPEQFEQFQFKPDADGHIFLFSADDIRLVAADAGLVVETASLFTNPLTRGALRLDRLLPYVPEPVVRLGERITAVAGGRPFSRVNMQLLVVLRRPGP